MTGDENDIRREIKRFIANALSLPYVYNVQIIRYLLIKKITTAIFTDGKERENR